MPVEIAAWFASEIELVECGTRGDLGSLALALRGIAHSVTWQRADEAFGNDGDRLIASLSAAAEPLMWACRDIPYEDIGLGFGSAAGIVGVLVGKPFDAELVAEQADRTLILACRIEIFARRRAIQQRGDQLTRICAIVDAVRVEHTAGMPFH